MKKNIYSSMQNKSSSWFNFRLVVLSLMVFGIMVPLFIQVALQFHQQNGSQSRDDLYLSRMILNEDLQGKREELLKLKSHIQELRNIKYRTLQALVHLDKKRVSLLTEIQEGTNTKNSLNTEIRSLRRQVQKAKKEITFIQESQSHQVVKNIIYVGIPKKLNLNNEPYSNKADQKMVTKKRIDNPRQCNFRTCFDFSRCSIIKDFHIYTNPESLLFNVVNTFPEFNANSSKACINIITVKSSELLKLKIGSNVNALIVVEPSVQHETVTSFCNRFYALDQNIIRGVVVFPHVCRSYRLGFDYLLPTSLPMLSKNLWKTILPLFPVKRKFLLSFYSIFKGTNNLTSAFVRDLETLEGSISINEDISMNLKCSSQKCTSGWCVCDKFREILSESAFSLIPLETSNAHFLDNIIQMFTVGVVPIFVGEYELLPFSDLIDWQKASIFVQHQRLPELYYILKTTSLNNVITLKQQGRFLLETYFSSKEKILKTIIAHMKINVGLPPTTLRDFKAHIINNETNLPNSGFPTSSFSYIDRNKHRNMSYVGLNRYEHWNRYPGAINTFPMDHKSPMPPSEIQFLDDHKSSFMPIGDGKGGDGAAFSRSLGGDHAIEQFTVLMLTYDRDVILMEALQRLSGMRYLNKVVVVWNHPSKPSKDLQWPDIGIKVEVVKAEKNSLNNRFIPYEIIETEAILSMDDDIYLRHDEIELAFRVWRENRDRLVGFPGRHHSYNSSSRYFYYNSEHSCELSLVLTGGAFFHKYYSYVYTYIMDKSIKSMVDEFMNCEDIAMNFLVAHITNKPPIKVTSRWTFRCPGCPASLSTDKDHYIERNRCMEFFQKVFGYNPLKRTQFRADSVLFKTRLPSALTKCFQFV